MKISDSQKSKLLLQKNLLAVWLISNRNIPSHKSHSAITILCSFLVLVSALFSIHQTKSDIQLFQTILIISELAFNLSASILGFLIAGFSIFASITKPKIMIILANTDYKSKKKLNNEITNLQYVFFAFLNTFLVYFVLLSASIIIRIVSANNSIFYTIGYFTYKCFPIIPQLTNILCLVGLSCCMAVSLLRLKSFIWNLYQAILTAIMMDEVAQNIEQQSDDKTKT